jgi:hypothetical protein
VLVQDKCTVCVKHTRFRKSFWMHPMVHRGEEAQLVHLVIVLILIEDRCTVCVERTLGSEIILDAPIELLSDAGHVDSHFGPFGDNVSVGAR